MISYASRPRVRLFENFSPFLVANIALLVLALLAGGASRVNAIPAMVVELASLAMLPWAIYRLCANSNFKALWWPLGIVTGLALIVTLQLVPVPPSLWAGLGEGSQIKAIYNAANLPLAWRPLSIAPELTIHSSLSLVTPIAVFLGWMTLSTRARRIGTLAVMIITVLNLVLGAAQIAGGDQSPAYLYFQTNRGSLVGFFANRNHEASLFLCSIPLIAGFIATQSRRKAINPVLVVLGLGMALGLLASLAAVKSRAGILLASPALAASIFLLVRSGRLGDVKKALLAIMLAVFAIVAVIVPLGLRPLLERFDNSFSNDLRFSAAPLIWRAALHNLPLGSGLGSFDKIYRSIEPLNVVSPEFLNHAHDDFLEVFLEGGLFGVGLILIFVVWWAYQSWRAWVRRSGHEANLARAGSIIIAILLAHSVVDYPLRTLALSSLLGLACSFLLSPEVSFAAPNERPSSLSESSICGSGVGERVT